MNVLVVPTNSAARLAEFLTAWAPWPWDRILVIQDAAEVDLIIPEPLQEIAAERLEAFSWAEIDRTLPDPSIISREDAGIRSFGFLRAWAIGAEVIFTTDDDCFPTGDDFVGLHRKNLFGTPMWQSSVPEGMRVRGLPYRNLGVLPNVQVSHGLWRGTPDLDGVTALADTEPGSVSSVGARVMPERQYFPFSGMNFAFRREAACLMYFPPMGRGQPFGRFDDIWCGIALQRICRHLGYSIVCGEPFVHHRRASDAFVNLVKEAPGIAVNEHLWETIDAVELSASEPRTCMAELGIALAASDDEYVALWGRNIGCWCELFEQAARPVAVQAAA